MALRLTVTSDQRNALGPEASIVLGVGGGSIGRAHDNDWVLPDPECFVSAHHARVQFRRGTYYLIDTSTNGTYLNEGSERLNPRNIYPLRDGDRLRLGRYEIDVGVDAEVSEAPEASAIFSVPAAEGARGGAQTDIGASLDVRQLLGVGAPPDSDSQRVAVDAFGQSISGLRSLPPSRAAQRTIATASAAVAAAAPATAAPPPAPAAAASPAASAAGQADPALEALCRGAGFDLRRLPAEVRPRIAHLAGLLLREALGGLKGLSLAQREQRDQAQLEVGREDAQNVALTGLAVEELLLRLLLGHDRRELDAVRWVRDVASHTRAHDLAMLRALPGALAEFSARLDPRSLAHHSADAEEQAASGSTGVTARFRSITVSAPGTLPQLFAEAFAHAYMVEFRRAMRDGART